MKTALGVTAAALGLSFMRPLQPPLQPTAVMQLIDTQHQLYQSSSGQTGELFNSDTDGMLFTPGTLDKPDAVYHIYNNPVTLGQVSYPIKMSKQIHCDHNEAELPCSFTMTAKKNLLNERELRTHVLNDQELYDDFISDIESRRTERLHWPANAPDAAIFKRPVSYSTNGKFDLMAPAKPAWSEQEQNEASIWWKSNYEKHQVAVEKRKADEKQQADEQRLADARVRRLKDYW